jgi:hypothetical protein
MTVEQLMQALERIENKSSLVWVRVNLDERDEVAYTVLLEQIGEFEDAKTNELEVWLEGNVR